MSLHTTFRDRFALAASASEWDAHIADVERLVADTNPPDLPEVVRVAVLASNYAYLRRDSSTAARLLGRAEMHARSEPDASKQQPLLLPVSTGWHRLYRNLHTYSDLRRARYDIERLLLDLPGLHPTEPVVIEARLELTHFARYEGVTDPALDEYCDIARHLPPRDDYWRWLVVHYIVSSVCDLAELLILAPNRPADSGPASLFGRLLTVFPVPPAKYPMLRALFEKHRALWYAGCGEFGQAHSNIEDALAILGHLGSEKGVLLCREFRALVNAAAGKRADAIIELEAVAQDATGYYPRLTGRARLHVARLRLSDTNRPMPEVLRELRAQQDHRPLQSGLDRAAAREALFTVRRIRLGEEHSASTRPVSQTAQAAHLESLAGWASACVSPLISGELIEQSAFPVGPPSAVTARVVAAARGGPTAMARNRIIQLSQTARDVVAIMVLVLLVATGIAALVLPMSAGWKVVLVCAAFVGGIALGLDGVLGIIRHVAEASAKGPHS